MSIDLSQFYEVFIEESFEGLDVMESELLNLEPGDLDSEIINTIFRAAHSIKGGSGTFGFMAIADFTHVLETLLDQIRNKERELESRHVDLLLQSVDCLRSMLTAIQNNEPQESEEANRLRSQFEIILTGKSEQEVIAESLNETEGDENEVKKEELITLWQIIFSPKNHLFRTGNEPLFLFEDLAELGETTISANVENLPNLEDLNAEDCYLNWTITLDSAIATEESIKEVFEWVEDDADIEISKKAQIEDFSFLNQPEGNDANTVSLPDDTQHESTPII